MTQHLLLARGMLAPVVIGEFPDDATDAEMRPAVKGLLAAHESETGQVADKYHDALHVLTIRPDGTPEFRALADAWPYRDRSMQTRDPWKGGYLEDADEE